MDKKSLELYKKCLAAIEKVYEEAESKIGQREIRYWTNISRWNDKCVHIELWMFKAGKEGKNEYDGADEYVSDKYSVKSATLIKKFLDNAAKAIDAAIARYDSEISEAVEELVNQQDGKEA